MELLRDPRLLERIRTAAVRRGGRGDQQLVGYLGVVSRHWNRRSRSCAIEFRRWQKFADGSRARVPARRAARSILRHDGAVTLLYGEQDLKHKVLAIVEEEGAHTAAYALKLLQSEGVLTIASTGKDPANRPLADPSI